MIVLKEQRRLFAEESCRHIFIPFEVPFDGAELCVRFSFSPSILEDKNKALALLRQGMARYEPEKKFDNSELEKFLPLNNMLTLSIDSPDGFVGTAHRYGIKQLLKISAKKSARGFFPQAVKKGIWRVTVSPFHFVTQYVDFDLEVNVE